MKRHLTSILVVLILASGLVVGCGQKARPGATPATSVASLPTKSQDEVCALVYNHIEKRATLVSLFGYRINLLDALSRARPYFRAAYQGNGKWHVSALGMGVAINLDEYKENVDPDSKQSMEAMSASEKEELVWQLKKSYLDQHFPSKVKSLKGVYSVFTYDGLWNLYEASGAVEPVNDTATELLFYIQWLTR